MFCGCEICAVSIHGTPVAKQDCCTQGSRTSYGGKYLIIILTQATPFSLYFFLPIQIYAHISESELVANIYCSLYIQSEPVRCACIAMRCLLVLCAITAAALGRNLQHGGEWRQWKEYHSKVYASEAEESARRGIWDENSRLVENHNRDASRHRFTLALNHFADLVS